MTAEFATEAPDSTHWLVGANAPAQLARDLASIQGARQMADVVLDGRRTPPPMFPLWNDALGLQAFCAYWMSRYTWLRNADHASDVLGTIAKLFLGRSLRFEESKAFETTLQKCWTTRERVASEVCHG